MKLKGVRKSTKKYQHSDNDYLLIARGIRMHFPIRLHQSVRSIRIPLKAVDDVDMSIKKGEVVGLVGESGCGKTTLGRVLINLISPVGGDLFFVPDSDLSEKLASNEKLSEKELKTHSLYRLSKKKQRELRKKMQIVFQDPYSSLDPRYLVKDIISEPLISFKTKKEDAYSIARKLLVEVGLSEDFMNRYPHQLSGGQRQRVAVARALAPSPDFVVLDEPTSALDVSVQAQVLNILSDLRDKHNLTMLFISHNMMVTRHISDRIYVMYLGKIVEIADTENLFSNPLHPYSIALLSAVPIPNTKTKRARVVLEGDVPSPIFKPRGCSFHTRCRFAFEKCGWTSDESVESISVVLDPGRNRVMETIPAMQNIEVLDDNSFVVHFSEPLSEEQYQAIKGLVDEEKENGTIRALYGIRSTELAGGDVRFDLFHEISQPPMMKTDEEGHSVACWLYEKKE